MSDDWVLVGRIGAAHGVRGQVKVESFTQDPAALGRFGPLFGASAATRFDIVLLRRLKASTFVAKIAGVQSRTEAEALTNVSLYVGRSHLPALAEDEFYHADLIGMSAEDPRGRTIGRVTAVLDFGAGDILQIARPDGSELLLPFTQRIIQTVDMTLRRLVAEPPVEISGESD